MALKLIISRQPDGQEIFHDFSASSLSEINSSQNSVVLFFAAQTITGNGDVNGEKYYYGTRISLGATGRGATLGESLGRIFSIALQSPDVESRINLFELADSISIEDIVGSAPSGGGPTGGAETLDSVTTRGATTGNAINVGGITTDFVQLDLTATPISQPGMFSWNEDRSTVNLQLDADVAAKIGQDNFWYVKNQSGSDIPIRTAVMASGALGASGRILVSPMVADGTVDAKFLLGITAEEIEDGADGFVMNIGKLRQVNTSLFPSGTVLYCDPTVPGGLTGSEPQAPNLKLSIAFSINQSTNNGTIAIRTNPGTDLYSDHRVQIDQPGLTGGQLLRYNYPLERWENWTPNFLTTVPTLAQVTAAGATTTTEMSVGPMINSTGDFNSRLELSGEGGFHSSKFTFNDEGRFIAGQVGVRGADDIFFQALPNTTQGYGFLEAWRSAGMILGTGGNSSPVIFQVNRGEKARIVSTGNLLIGTTTDAGFKLDVNGSIRTTSTINATLANVSTANVVYYNTTNGLFTYGAAGGGGSVPTLAQVTTAGNTTTNSISVGGINATNNFVFTLNRTVNAVSDSPKLRWTGSNVGTIEVYGDQNRLVVSASSGVNASSFQGNFVNFGASAGSVSSPLLRGTNNFTGGLFFIGGGGVAGNAGIGFSIGNYTEGMRLVSTGNVLIGTTTDAGYKLDVNGSVNATGYIAQGVTGYSGSLFIPGNPPGSQNIIISGGIITNIN